MENEKNTEVSAVTLENTAITANNDYTSGIFDEMAKAYRLAKVMCKAGNIPDNYKDKPADCMIAIDMAGRMGVSPLMVMQNLYVVKGKPSWSGQACMSFIQSNPDFTDIMPVYTGEAGRDTRGCYISAKRTSDGVEIKGVCVTIGMARAEGWTKNSKWQNMPDLMLAYRAAAFFARVYCPQVLMGVSVEGEAEDADSKKKNEKKAVNIL